MISDTPGPRLKVKAGGASSRLSPQGLRIGRAQLAMQLDAHPSWTCSKAAEGAVAAVSPGSNEGTLFAPCNGKFVHICMAFDSSETCMCSP